MGNQVLLCHAIYSCQRFSSSSEFRAVVAALTTKVGEVSERVDAEYVGNMLYGLREAEDAPEIRGMCAAVGSIIAKSKGVMSDQSIVMCLRGLAPVGESDGSRAALEGLVSKMSGSHEELSAFTCGNAFTMLLNKGSGPEVSALLNLLVSPVGRVCHKFSAEQISHAQKVLEGMTGLVADKMRTALLPVLEQGVGENISPMLPDGWSAHSDGAGRIFYHHKEHGSQWNVPVADELPAGWEMHTTADGKTYYHHQAHGSRWERPVETLSVEA